MRCVQRRACPRPLHLNLFPTSTPPLINYLQLDPHSLEGGLGRSSRPAVHCNGDGVGPSAELAHSNQSIDLKVLQYTCVRSLVAEIRILREDLETSFVKNTLAHVAEPAFVTGRPLSSLATSIHLTAMYGRSHGMK